MNFNYENLAVWKLSLSLIEKIYNLSRFFPKEELFILTSQIKRSIISVA